MNKENETKAIHTAKEKDLAMRVSKVSIIINLLLSTLKFIAGVIGHSQAMISDAVHSASDVLSTFVVIIGVTLSGKKSDDEHPYGHERLECVASIILAILLGLTGIGIGKKGLEDITTGAYRQLAVPGLLALIAAIVSIAVKEWMFWYTRGAAKKIKSGSLMADAWHHRSDALSSVGALIGIGGARMGFAILDPIASVVICLCILKAAYDIFKDSIDKLVDKACPKEVEERMREVILAQDGVEGLDSLQSRLFGNKYYVDVEIAADGNKTLNETHAIAEHVHDAIEEEFEGVKHCMVHVNPKQ